MIERMARAMCETDPFVGVKGPIPWDNVTKHGKDRLRRNARAALAAMLEPSEAMLDRFVSRALCVSVHGEGGWSDYARGQWQTMIQAALDEK